MKQHPLVQKPASEGVVLYIKLGIILFGDMIRAFLRYRMIAP